MKENIIKHNFSVNHIKRQELKGHTSFVLWFTGLSGSGKSTIADNLDELLFSKGIHTYTLDGDNVRKGLNNDLTFSPEDRKENIRRIGEVSKLMLDAGLVVLSSFVSPYQEDRNQVRQIVGENNFLEVFIDTPLEECERRDVKGLYVKARKGLIKDFTGISAPYEKPADPFIRINTLELSIEESILLIFSKIKQKLKKNE